MNFYRFNWRQRQSCDHPEVLSLIFQFLIAGVSGSIDNLVKMGSEDEIEHDGDHELKAERSDSDSDFEVSGKGRKKQAKGSNKRRKTDGPTVPKIPRCRQCRQRTDDNPNLVSVYF